MIEELEKLEKDLVKSEKNYRQAYDKANFYKDLFAHDMSNIIQNISLAENLYTNYLNEISEHSEKLNKIHDVLRNQVKSAKKLITNINKLSTLESESIELRPIALLKCLNKAIAFLKESFQEKEIDIVIETYQDNIKTRANELLIDVFQNILLNAVKYNDNERPEIIIKITKPDPNLIKLEFIDNGIGISEKLKEKIFLKGYKKLKGDKGMGLGLSLVSNIINSFGGKIWVENRVKHDYSKGSKFFIIIPGI